MKTVALLLTALACALASRASAQAPKGTLLELHSCQLYAGGCIISSEATLGGRYMLRAWNFTDGPIDGSIDGTRLAGLSVALLQCSSDNLAAPEADPGQAIAYVPESANASQRQALVAWARRSASLAAAAVTVRALPFSFTSDETGYQVTGGKCFSVSTAPFDTCEAGACGEALWYTPRSPTSVFTVLVARSAHVAEPALKLKWDDAGRRTIFLGKFGEPTPARNLFVGSSELCAPANGRL